MKMIKRVGYGVALSILSAGAVLAQNENENAEIGDYGVNLVGHIGGAGTKVGTYVLAVIAVMFAFIAIRFGLKWFRRAV